MLEQDSLRLSEFSANYFGNFFSIFLQLLQHFFAFVWAILFLEFSQQSFRTPFRIPFCIFFWVPSRFFLIFLHKFVWIFFSLATWGINCFGPIFFSKSFENFQINGLRNLVAILSVEPFGFLLQNEFAKFFSDAFGYFCGGFLENVYGNIFGICFKIFLKNRQSFWKFLR